MTGTQLISIGLVLAGGLIWWLRPGSKGLRLDGQRDAMSVTLASGDSLPEPAAYSCPHIQL